MASRALYCTIFNNIQRFYSSILIYYPFLSVIADAPSSISSPATLPIKSDRKKQSMTVWTTAPVRLQYHQTLIHCLTKPARQILLPENRVDDPVAPPHVADAARTKTGRPELPPILSQNEGSAYRTAAKSDCSIARNSDSNTELARRRTYSDHNGHIARL